MSDYPAHKWVSENLRVIKDPKKEIVEGAKVLKKVGAFKTQKQAVEYLSHGVNLFYDISNEFTTLQSRLAEAEGVIGKMKGALEFYGEADYHFDPFSRGARELQDDEGEKAKQALTAANEYMEKKDDK